MQLYNGFDDVASVYILSGPLPESPEQEQPHNRWLGGETEALALFKSRMEVEERVSPYREWLSIVKTMEPTIYSKIPIPIW